MRLLERYKSIEDGKTMLTMTDMGTERERRNQSEKIGKGLGQTARLALKLKSTCMRTGGTHACMLGRELGNS